MIPTRQSRYAITARRAIAARRAAVAALALAPGLACGGGDAEVFDVPGTAVEVVEVVESSSPGVTSLFDTSDTAALPATTLPATSLPEITEITEPSSPETFPTETFPTETSPPDASPVSTFPESAELAVSFTFSPQEDGGRILNPYIAVWVEDADGNLVKTVSLWFEQSRKGPKWLSDLRQWAAVSGQVADETTTGATRVAGDYTVVWDGTDVDGNLVAQGEYVLLIEAAREKGPYEITSRTMTIGDDGFTITLDDNGELTNASAQLMV